MTPALFASLESVAQSSPDRRALVSKDGFVTYAELWGRSLQLAAGFRCDGVSAGNRIVLVLDNTAEFVVAYLAAMSVGAVVVPWNPQAPCAALESVFQDCTPRVAILEQRHREWLPALSRFAALSAAYIVHRTDAGESNFQRWPEPPSGPPESHRPSNTDPNDLAAIIYTSGTTGTPKGVMLSRANLDAIAAAGIDMLQLSSNDRIGIVAPLFHLYALREVDAALRLGATVLLPPGGLFLTNQLAFLCSAGVTGMSAVPSALAIMTEKYPAGLSALGERLRNLTIGTAPATIALITRLRELLPKTRIVLTYGLTECSRVCYRDGVEADEEHIGGNVGRPYPGVTLELQNPSEGVGRVIVRSPMVMQGYWNRPDATAAVLQPDGSLLTPDCGRISDDGSLHLLGRIDDIINCGGHKVSPDEVEEVLARHPGVARVAVSAAPDPVGVLGQVVRAVVVPREAGLSTEELLRHSAKHLEPYKIPKLIDFVAEIPRSVLGKPQRARLS